MTATTMNLAGRAVLVARIGLLSLAACASDPQKPAPLDAGQDAAADGSTVQASDARGLPDADSALVDARAGDAAAADCLASSGRPGGCACGAKKECEFECVTPSADQQGVELRCADVRRAVCSKVRAPSGCYCVLGDDGGGAADLCWDGVL